MSAITGLLAGVPVRERVTSVGPDPGREPGDALQLQMQAQGTVDPAHDGGGQPAESRSEPLDRDRSHLLALRLRVDPQPAEFRLQLDLERAHTPGASARRFSATSPTARRTRRPSGPRCARLRLQRPLGAPPRRQPRADVMTAAGRTVELRRYRIPQGARRGCVWSNAGAWRGRVRQASPSRSSAPLGRLANVRDGMSVSVARSWLYLGYGVAAGGSRRSGRRHARSGRSVRAQT